MNKIGIKHLIFVFCLLFSGSASYAQTAALTATPQAELFRVEEGLFSLRFGQSIDISDKYLLLTLTSGNRDCLAISMNGRKHCLELGNRYDLKDSHAPFHLRDLMADKQQCFLDVVNIDSAKGAELSATFRLHCV